MQEQQIDLLRVGQLALRVARLDHGAWNRGNLYASALEEMHYSTRLSVATCQKVMEQLARQASQQGYESDLNAIRSATEKIRREKKQAAGMGSMAAFSELRRPWRSLKEEVRHD